MNSPRFIAACGWLALGLSLIPYSGYAQTILDSELHDNPLFGTTFVEDGNRIWFSATTFLEGGELWLTDGTNAGTRIAAQVTPGNDLELPVETVVAGGKAFFMVDGENDWELWMSDGTQAGTQRIAEHAVPSFAENNPILNGIAEINDQALAFVGDWLVRVDPASGDTLHLHPAAMGEGMVKTADFVFAFATNPVTFASELIRTDGTIAGTSVLSNIAFLDEDEIGLAGNRLIFFANDFSGAGEELYVSDGTPGGTGFLPELLPGDDDPACADIQSGDGVVYLGLRSADYSGCKPYQSDGTAAGTVPIVDQTWLLVHSMQRVGDYIYFWESAVNLWRTDGTSDGTIQLATVDGTSPPVIAFDNAAWFAGFVNGAYTLWRSDGTVEGTMQVFENPAATVDPLSMTVIGDRLYFSAFSTYYFEASDNTANEELTVDASPVEPAFPNPFDGQVFVEIPGSSVFGGTSKIFVFDVLGRQVFQQSFASSDTARRVSISLRHLPAGVYFLQTRVGRNASTQQVVRL